MPWAIAGWNEKKRWYQSPWPWVGVTVAIGLFLLLLPRAQNLYRGWNEQRRLKRAEEALTAGDFRRTMVNVQMVLMRNPRSVPAVQMGIRALEGLNSPEVLHFRRRLDTLTDDPDNKLALASDTLRAGDPLAAQRTLEALPAERRRSARFHEIAARCALALGRRAEAEKSWAQAVQLAPKEERYQLESARLRAASKDAAVRQQGMESLERLSASPQLRLEALRTLLANAASFRETSRTRAFADQLVAEPGATFADRITRLTVVYRFARGELPAALSELQDAAAADPVNAFLLLSWMNTHDQALLVPEWEPRLSAAVLAMPQVKSALAEALARASAWDKLALRLKDDSWQELDFLRFAYLARSHERLGDDNATLAAWTNALNAAQEKSRSLEILGRTCLSWGWEDRADETLWRLATHRDCPRWAVDRLWQQASAAQDTPKMFAATQLLLKADPTSPSVRNNYAVLALLLGQALDEARRIALELYQQKPDDTVIASTYGLSLLQASRPWEAVAVMRAFPEDALRKPAMAFYHGLFLAAAGLATEAEPFLQLAEPDKMLPEERGLLAKYTNRRVAAPVVGAIDRTRTDTAALYGEARQQFLENPKSVTARANYIVLALLTRQNGDSARQLASALGREHPESPDAALAAALALFDQDRPAEAVGALGKIPEEQLAEPVRAAYFGLFLHASGQKERAEKFLALADQAALLPEEKALLARARARTIEPAHPSAPPRPETATTIAALDRRRADTAALYKAARQTFFQDPKNVTARVNYTTLALLTRKDTDTAGPLIRALYKEQPTDPDVTAAHALALHIEGRSAEAVAAMAKLPEAALAEPVRAAYYGAFLAGAGKGVEAARFLELARDATLLPEEKVLVEQARATLATPR